MVIFTLLTAKLNIKNPDVENKLYLLEKHKIIVDFIDNSIFYSYYNAIDNSIRFYIFSVEPLNLTKEETIEKVKRGVIEYNETDLEKIKESSKKIVPPISLDETLYDFLTKNLKELKSYNPNEVLVCQNLILPSSLNVTFSNHYILNALVIRRYYDVVGSRLFSAFNDVLNHWLFANKG